MPIQHIHTFLVHPKKGLEGASQVNGLVVNLSGKIFNLLGWIYQKSDLEHDIDITFKSNNGVQQNDCRDLICKYMNGPNRSIRSWV